MLDPIALDFETDAIVGNPVVNPPRPVGLSIHASDIEPTYLAWGHPTENNCYFGDAHKYVQKLVESKRPFLFHNAPFDISVWNKNFCNATIQWINGGWKRIHDTMFLLFLADPYSPTLSLKPSALRYLGLPPDEQQELHNWILANVPEATPKTAGAYISRAPGNLVERYANGDVIRTLGLYRHLFPLIQERGMEAAYDRERRLMPTLMGGTRHGIRVDRDALQLDERRYTDAVQSSSIMLASKLGCSVDSLGHDETLADALEACGAVTQWVYTKTGKRSMAKGNLQIVNPEIKMHMEYISGLSTCLQTFMRPWLEFSQADGRVHPSWNQVRTRGEGGGHDVGTRTGRLSSSGPNFQNVPTEFTDNQGRPLPVPEGLPPFPLMRRYCLPEPGHVWLKRDFSSQEIRILAHFEDGALCQAYRGNPSLDPHQMALDLITQITGITYARKDIKITGFSIIYGSGATGLAIQLGTEKGSAFAIREAYLDAMPGLRTVMQDVQLRGRSGQPIRTWGGRLYFAEPPKEIDGRMRDFAYKLLNYLIQGSAADQTKESINDWADLRKWDAVFLATVHDEINISAPKEAWQEHMATLRECMNRDRFDVPMLSEGFVGPNWEDIEDVVESN